VTVPAAFEHRIRVRYAECDAQGVVFNAHWLTYFDETCTRFVEAWGFGPDFWINEFDVMLVKAVLEWSGPARFDDWLTIDAGCERIGTKSFDIRYRASVDGRAACAAVITYVAVAPGTTGSMVVPDAVRDALAARPVP
jgi:acyl-CoA thioester hydrolase